VAEWEISFDKVNKIWSWYLPLPNGWTAAVTDDSDFGYPKRPTRYLVSAISRNRIIQGDTWGNILGAKSAALELALHQETVDA